MDHPPGRRVSSGGALGRGRAHREPRRPGRPRGHGAAGAATRDRILEAARTTFAEHGFDAATVRAIAAEAGVDPALVLHYFGTKQRLFMAAIEFPVRLREVLSAVAREPRNEIGELLIRRLVEIWDQPEVLAVILGIVRSAATDEIAAASLRRLVVDGPLTVVATALQVPDAELRATLAGTQIIGLILARYVVRVEPVASLSGTQLATLVGPTITRYLTADLGDLGPVVGVSSASLAPGAPHEDAVVR
jgi:AcrR family transcriptional regulator